MTAATDVHGQMQKLTTHMLDTNTHIVCMLASLVFHSEVLQLETAQRRRVTNIDNVLCTPLCVWSTGGHPSEAQQSEAQQGRSYT